jgi:REP element-mobilizing transposase RayT
MAKIIYEVDERCDVRILELAVMPYHVHLFTLAPPDVVSEKLLQTIQVLPPARCLSELQASKSFSGAVLCGSEATS